MIGTGRPHVAETGHYTTFRGQERGGAERKHDWGAPTPAVGETQRVDGPDAPESQQGQENPTRHPDTGPQLKDV